MEKPTFILRHIGINPDENRDAALIVREFSEIFEFPIKQGRSSIFAGDIFEIMLQAGPGEKGHIAIGTDSVENAVSYLTQNGVTFDQTSAKRNADGRLTSIYLNREIGGFAIHLLQN